jgi:hypothetical protein
VWRPLCSQFPPPLLANAGLLSGTFGCCHWR